MCTDCQTAGGVGSWSSPGNPHLALLQTNTMQVNTNCCQETHTQLFCRHTPCRSTLTVAKKPTPSSSADKHHTHQHKQGHWQWRKLYHQLHDVNTDTFSCMYLEGTDKVYFTKMLLCLGVFCCCYLSLCFYFCYWQPCWPLSPQKKPQQQTNKKNNNKKQQPPNKFLKS